MARFVALPAYLPVRSKQGIFFFFALRSSRPSAVASLIYILFYKGPLVLCLFFRFKWLVLLSVVHLWLYRIVAPAVTLLVSLLCYLSPSVCTLQPRLTVLPCILLTLLRVVFCQSLPLGSVLDSWKQRKNGSAEWCLADVFRAVILN